MTYAEFMEALNGKLSKPAQSGAAAQLLATDGNGGRSWVGPTVIASAATVEVDGVQYTLRTGSAGAAGYLTIAPGQLYLGTRRVMLAFGASAVRAIYKGTDLVYSRAAGSTVLFDAGWVGGVSWTGNYFAIPSGHGTAAYNMAYVTSDGYMQLIVYSGYAGTSMYAHVCTENKVAIPAGVTKLKVTATRPTAQACDINIGLLPDSAESSISTAQGGVMSGNTAASYGEATYEIALVNGMAGTSLYRPVINIHGSRHSTNAEQLRISKVWFE